MPCQKRKLKNILQIPGFDLFSQTFKYKIFQPIEFYSDIAWKTIIICYSIFHVTFLKQRFRQVFLNLYDLDEEIMTANIKEVINLFTTSDSKVSMGAQSTLFCVDTLWVLNLSIWSKSPPIAWAYNFYQIHPVTKNDNSFQSRFCFPDLNPISHMASCNGIKMSPMYFYFTRAHYLKIHKFTYKFIDYRFYMSRVLVLIID